VTQFAQFVVGQSAMKNVKEGNGINLSVRFLRVVQKKELQTFWHIRKLVIHQISALRLAIISRTSTDAK
jgi:hypothetical protein